MSKPRKIFRLAAAASIGASAGLAGGRLLRASLMPRRDPEVPFRDLYLVSEDGVGVAARIMGSGSADAVVVSHAAVTGQRYAPLVAFGEKLSRHFDVYTFDFRGHGRSGGRLDLDLEGPVEDLRAIVLEARRAGHDWIGLAGFSLGGMASLLYAARFCDVQAVASIGAPPRLPDIGAYRRWLPIWSVFLRLLGARFNPGDPGRTTPMQAAQDFPDIPLLVVHGERDVFYSRKDLDEMLEKLGAKAELWVIESAGHTELAGREEDLIRWLVERRNEAKRAAGTCL